MSLPARALEMLLAWPGLAGRRVHAVWLFGSHAAGRAGEGSDIDLAVWCEPALGFERVRAMDAIGRELGVDVDLIDLGTAPAYLRWEVVTTGKLILERDEEMVEQFVRRARFDAEDEEQLNRMALLAGVDRIGTASR